MAEHRIEVMVKSWVKCKCGWFYKLADSDEDGSDRYKSDKLLDMFNIHKKRKERNNK